MLRCLFALQHELLEDRYSIYLRQEDGTRQLFIASQYGNVDCVRVLVEHGASVDVLSTYYKKMQSEKGVQVDKTFNTKPLWIVSIQASKTKVRELLLQSQVVNGAKQSHSSDSLLVLLGLFERLLLVFLDLALKKRR